VAIVTRLSHHHGSLEPTFPPIQQVAGDARRLRRLLASLPPGASYVRSVGVATAYDEILALACRMLEVPNCLLRVRHGRLRELERLRVEFELGERGLLL
jgi:hypothetical protein